MTNAATPADGPLERTIGAADGASCSVKPAMVDRDVLRSQIQAKYTDVATKPELGFHFHTGRPLAAMLGYAEADVEWLPASTVESFAGTGNPLSQGTLPAGATVLDLGSGAGFDTLLAARQVGPTGRVIPVDMTEGMLNKARVGAAALGLENVDPRIGFAEELPVEDGEVDVVISNGVVNLTPDKVATMAEINRALRPGGRIQIADIYVQSEVPQDAKDDIDLWAGSVAGALLEAEWREVLAFTGFDNIEWGLEVDVFSGSKHESDAAEFQTRGITFAATKVH